MADKTEQPKSSGIPQEYEAILTPFIGKEAIVSTSMGEVTGKVNTPEYDLGYVDFLPHIVIRADGKHVYLENETPYRLGLGSFNDSRFSIRPLQEGYLEKKVAKINADADNSTKRMGFNPDETKK